MRVLVVEDEEAMAASLRAGLTDAGFAVDVAGDGEEALWYAAEATYDAIVLDLMLPKLNGFLVCRALRERDDWTPVLMLTAKDGDLDEAEGLDTGADDYLTKPFSFAVLLARLRALTRRRTAERPTVLTAAGVELDPATRIVRRGETVIELTAKEVAVLETLLRNAGTVVSKARIVESVWSFDFEGDHNIVEVYVRSLRKKLDEPFGTDSITTVRGAGYRLGAPDG